MGISSFHLSPHPKIAFRLWPREHGCVDEHLAEVLQVPGEVESAGRGVRMRAAVVAVTRVAGGVALRHRVQRAAGGQLQGHIQMHVIIFLMCLKSCSYVRQISRCYWLSYDVDCMHCHAIEMSRPVQCSFSSETFTLKAILKANSQVPSILILRRLPNL